MHLQSRLYLHPAQTSPTLRMQAMHPRWPIASAPNPDQSDTSPSTFDPAVLAHSDQANAAIQRAVDVASRDQLDEQTDMPPPSVVAEATQDLGRIGVWAE